MQKLLIICIVSYTVLCVSINTLHAQNKTIKGRIVDDNLETLPFVSIVINDTIKIGKSDVNGFFQIDIPVSVEKISFESVGLESATIKLVDKCDEVEIVMMLSGTYDFTTLKRVNKIRMKRFKQLPKLHKEAFDKGIFKTDKACYTQELIAYYKKHKSDIKTQY